MRGLKAFILILLVFTAVMSGCAMVNVRTVVVPEENNHDALKVGRSYALNELIPHNMTLKKIVGFDEQNRVVGWFTKGANCCIMVFDVENRVGQQVVETGEKITNVKLSGNGGIVYETDSNGSRNLYMIAAGGGRPEKIAEYSAEGSVIGVNLNNTPVIYTAYRTNGELKLLVLDTASDMACATFDITKTIRESAGEYYSSSVRLTDISIGRDGRAAVLVNVGKRCYMWTGVLTDEGKLRDSIVLECGGTKHLCAERSIFYVDADGTLMRLDTDKNEQSAVVRDVDGFSVSADEQVIAYLRSGGSVKKLYVKALGASDEILLDIKQSLNDFAVSRDGTRIIVGYYDKDDDSRAKYTVSELKR